MPPKSLCLRVRFPANPVSNSGDLAADVRQGSGETTVGAKKLLVGGSVSEAEFHAAAQSTAPKEEEMHEAVVSDKVHSEKPGDASDDLTKVKKKKTKRSSVWSDVPQKVSKPVTVIVAPPSSTSSERKLKRDTRRESVTFPAMDLDDSNSVYGSFSFDIFQGDSEDYHDKQDIFQRNLLTLAEKSSRLPEPERTKHDSTVTGITTLSQLRKVVFLNRTINTTIGPEDLKAQLILDNRHLEMWDTEDDVFYACTAELHLTCENYALSDITGGPNASQLAIDCYTISPCRTKSSDTYAVSYSGHTFTEPSGTVPDYGIQIQPRWLLTVYEDRSVKWGWYIKFCIPIPVHLFTKMETRTFRVLARIAIGSSENYKVLRAYDDMSVSHLRREREMI